MNAPPPFQPQPPPQAPQGYGQPQGYPPPPGLQGPPGRAQKKGANGCLVALGIIGGIVVLIGIVIAFFVYRFATSPDGKKIVSAVASGAALVSQASNAPGTKEMRAQGCKVAMVLDPAQIAAIAEALGDGGNVSVSEDERLAVLCTPGRGASPTCDQIASTYVAAVGRAAGPFSVQVGANGATPECEARYLADGTRAPAQRGTRAP